MPYENSGILSKNERKGTDKHPDYTGSINVAGVDYWLSAWIKRNDKGKFMSLSVKRKDKQPQQAAPEYRKPSQDGAKARQLAPQRNNSGGFEDMDSDIPFRNPMRGARCLVM